MGKLNLDTEWNFVRTEIHKEKPNKKNILKRELLLFLQVLLGKVSNEFDEMVYKKTKQFYLNYNKVHSKKF